MLYKLLIIFECTIFAISVEPVLGLKNTCQSKTNKAHLYLATKTPYRYLVNKDDSPVEFEGCMAEKLWMIIRHGTRNPSQKVIRKMRERLPILQNKIVRNAAQNQTTLCPGEIGNLSSWSTELEEANEKRLTHVGEDEMIELAERYQNRFKHLLSGDYTNATFKFRHTATQRAAESARYFTIGLFGRKVSRYIWYPEALYRDPILRFYKLCPRWQKEIKKNPEAWIEKTMFEKTPDMEEALEDISKRLGFTGISIDDAVLMYVTCAFETAWSWNTVSPWCAVFSERDLEVMEYYADLEYYWVDGYGHNLTYMQACPALRDAFSFFDGSSMWGREARAVMYFTHSGTLLKMLAHLGLYYDRETLRHDNFVRHRTGRNWRVSRIDAFASNLVLVLFRCGEHLSVMALHQERPVRLPGCPETGPCPIEALRSVYSRSLHSCNFNRMCGRDQDL